MKHFGFSENGCIFGGAHAFAKHSACCFVGTEKARSAFELSAMLFASRAFWFVFTVATHDFVASE
jgi:hypothetical protein